MENIHYIVVYNTFQRRRARVQEPNELEEIDQHVEEVPIVTKKKKRSKTSYISPMMMVPMFEMRYYVSGVDQSSDFKTGYCKSEASSSSSN